MVFIESVTIKNEVWERTFSLELVIMFIYMLDEMSD
jgi:hypothetical protein